MVADRSETAERCEQPPSNLPGAQVLRHRRWVSFETTQFRKLCISSRSQLQHGDRSNTSAGTALCRAEIWAVKGIWSLLTVLKHRACREACWIGCSVLPPSSGRGYCLYSSHALTTSILAVTPEPWGTVMEGEIPLLPSSRRFPLPSRPWCCHSATQKREGSKNSACAKGSLQKLRNMHFSVLCF